jgi:hypothetical protein
LWQDVTFSKCKKTVRCNLLVSEPSSCRIHIGWSHESDRQNTKFYGQNNLFSRSNSMKELNFDQMAAVEGGGGGGCALNILAGAMIGGAIGGGIGALGGAGIMAVGCFFM